MSNFRLQAAPLPTNFRGTPQQLVEAFLDRAEVIGDGAEFVISDTEPSGNQGPWLKNGREWYVWDEDTSAYVPLDISASQTELIHVGDTAPDPDVTQIWLKLSGSTVVGLFYWMGSTDGWVQKASELGANVITTAMLQAQSIDRTKIKPGEIVENLLQNDLPLSKWIRGSSNQILRMSEDGGTAQWRDLFQHTSDLTITGSLAKLEEAHGLASPPTFVRPVLRCITAEHGWVAGNEVAWSQDWFATDTNVGVIIGHPSIWSNAASPVQFSIDLTKWRVRLYFA